MPSSAIPMPWKWPVTYDLENTVLESTPDAPEGKTRVDYYRAARDVNTPRLIVRPRQIGPARKELLARMPERFTYPEDE